MQLYRNSFEAYTDCNLFDHWNIIKQLDSANVLLIRHKTHSHEQLKTYLVRVNVTPSEDRCRITHYVMNCKSVIFKIFYSYVAM